MTSVYQYAPYVWPMLTAAVFLGALGIYVWRWRGVPGALPLAVALLFAFLIETAPPEAAFALLGPAPTFCSSASIRAPTTRSCGPDGTCASCQRRTWCR